MAKRKAKVERKPGVRKLAEAIASDLFTRGDGKKATRLGLILGDAGERVAAENLSGWGEKALADRIEMHLTKARKLLAERDRLRADLAEARRERDEAVRAALWLAHHAPGTPVPKWIDAALAARGPAAPVAEE